MKTRSDKSPRKDHRHRIEHMGNWLCTPERMQRMVRIGIIAIPNIAIGYYVGDAILDCVGEKRLTKAFPFHTLLKNGVIIAGGSDSPGYWPVDPFRDIAALRLAKMRWGEVWIPEEASVSAGAFAMHTTTASWVGFEENDKGSLEVGKLADIAVLAEDPFQIPGENQRFESGDDAGRRRDQIPGLNVFRRFNARLDGCCRDSPEDGPGIFLKRK